MKKILVVFMCMVAIIAKAQEIQVQVGEDLNKFIIEHTEVKNCQTLYGYAELTIGGTNYTYVQAFYEYSFSFVSLHAEYRGFLIEGSNCMNTYIAGFTLPLLSSHKYYASFSPLYRYDERSMWQATAVYSVIYKRISLDGYFDLYGDKSVYAFSENKIKFLFDKMFVGLNLEYSAYYPYSKLTPYAMIGFKF